jgi:uncharacterized protein YjlB
VTEPETRRFDADGGIPNSPLPVLVYHGVNEGHSASACRRLFAANGWTGAWVDGIFSFHHFHSTAHEVLGVVAGRAAVVLGGPAGERLEVRSGDVIVLPAGTSHQNDGSSGDFAVVGAYPEGTTWDLRHGDPHELADVLRNIAAVPLPILDPVQGAGGALTTIWHALGS